MDKNTDQSTIYTVLNSVRRNGNVIWLHCLVSKMISRKYDVETPQQRRRSTQNVTKIKHRVARITTLISSMIVKPSSQSCLQLKLLYPLFFQNLHTAELETWSQPTSV